MANLIDIILRAKNLASKELDNVTKSLKGMDKATKIAVGGFTSLAGSFAVMQTARFAVEMAQLNTQVERSAFAFDHFSGGADKAAANLRAVQRASGGMLTTFDAQNLAVTAMTQGLASNASELERITTIARGIVAVSPIINDLESAFGQLGLTIANQSTQRLDQLGTSAGEVIPKYNALKEANKSLSDAEAFQIALLETLESKFKSLTGATVNQASGIEELTRAWSDFRTEAAKSFKWIDSIAGRIADTLDTRAKVAVGADIATSALESMTEEQRAIAEQINKILNDPKNIAAAATGGFLPPEAENQIAGLVDQFFQLKDAAIEAKKAIEFGPKFEKSLPTFFTGADWSAKIQKDAKTAQEAINEILTTQAELMQNRALAETMDPDFADRVYGEVIAAGNEILRQQKELGRSTSDLVPIFQTLLRANTDWSFEDPERAVEELRGAVQSLTLDLAQAAKVRVFEESEGDLDAARQALVDTRNALGDFINKATQDIDTQNIEGLHAAYSELLTLLPSVAQMIAETGSAAAGAAVGFDMLADGIRNALSAAGAVGSAASGAMQGVAGTVSGILSSLTDLTSGMEMDLFGIGADFGQGLEGGRKYVQEMLPDVQQMVLAWVQSGATLEEITQVLLPNYLSDLESANTALYRTEKGTAAVNDEFNSLKSTISSIVSGAIGPVAGVDANDLLPRPDAVNENARRLADIAVNGLKGQDWLSEFAAEVPGIWDEIANSGDPQGTAARILKDFQDGLRPELLDKERAKELVKRALQGDANTKALIDEIAGELASELGISLSQAKEAAAGVLGGGTDAGTTGVSLSPKIDTGAAASAAVSFSSAFVGAIESGSLGADLGAALMVQVAGSVALVEQTGKDAGNVFVTGFTGAFDAIPTAFIAAVVSLAMPSIMANMSSNGGRTGAADV